MDILRKIVASPRARHDEANLDLCYVTNHIIATSGPSGTYPQIVYRNPLSSLVKFLDSKHADNWAIWEFRAEGTGYPDEEVYGRIRHYPWPDHHPPPFALVPLMMASMREWLRGNDERVCVVHCKAGKGRSGTVSCSYLISEEGWEMEKAMQTFTEKRMRPGFGSGISIPSQVRWVGYVDRWTKGGKLYVERQVEVLEVHVWGLRDGVKIAVEGYVDEGKVIKNFHTFTKDEREIVRGKLNKDNGFADVALELMGKKEREKEKDPKEREKDEREREKDAEKERNVNLNLDGCRPSTDTEEQVKSADQADSQTEKQAKPAEKNDSNSNKQVKNTGKDTTPSTGDVIFRPSTRVVLPSSDINIDFERRNNSKYGGFTMVTSVAHVWFNTYFEGRGPEQGGKPDDSGEFEIEFDAMDGIKGSSRKGTRAFDKMRVVWKAVAMNDEEKPGVVITEPKEGEEIPQARPADWKKGNDELSEDFEKKLGMREATTESADVSRASSVRTDAAVEDANGEDELEGVKHFTDGKDENVKSRKDAARTKTKSENDSPTRARELATSKNGTADGVSDAQVDGPTATSSEAQRAEKAAHPSTASLPDGRPEEEMHTHHEHALGSVKIGKQGESSS